MDITELHKLPHPPLVVTNLDIFSPLFTYGPEEGAIPVGTIITITGEPGTGKTKYALQLLDHICKFNEMRGIYNGYEQTSPVLAGYVKDLGLTRIHEFNLDESVPAIRPGEIHVIDSLDAFAALHYEKEYPDAKLAAWLKAAVEQGAIAIVVHHKTGTGRKESGSAKFNQYTSAVIELKKSGRNEVFASTKRKNRFPGSTNVLRLEHTKQGLRPAQTGWSRLASWAQNFTANVWER